MGERIAYPPEENPVVDQGKFDRKTERLYREAVNSQLDLETEAEELAGDWDRLLSFFGTPEARGRFIKLCQDYKTESFKYQRAEIGGENYRKKAASTPDSQKANIHNQIMKIYFGKWCWVDKIFKKTILVVTI